MTATLGPSPMRLTELVQATARTPSDEDRYAAVLAELQAVPLVPAVFVPGIEHQAAAAIVRVGLATVTYWRRTLHRGLDEHVFLDSDTRTAVRVMARWDDQAHQTRMYVAEAGRSGLWDRIVVHFTAWERGGRPVPEVASPGLCGQRRSAEPVRGSAS